MKRILALLLASVCCTMAGWETTPLRENGTIARWLIAGPLANGYVSTHGNNCVGYFRDYLILHGGETRVVPVEGDSIKKDDVPLSVWMQTSSAGNGLIDFIDNFAADSQTPYVAYAYCQLVSDRRQQALFKVRSNDGIKVWLNGEKVHDHHIGRRVEAEEDRLLLNLQKGENTLLCKVDQSGGGWGLLVTVVAVDETPIKGLSSRIQVNSRLSGKIMSANFTTYPIVEHTPAGERQMVSGVIKSGGLRQLICTIQSSDWPKPQRIKIKGVTAGTYRFDIKMPPLKQDTRVSILLESEKDRKLLQEVLFKKARPWFIYLVQHTHTDIGYTRPQNEMLAEYFRYLDWALDFCDQTDRFPDDARFRWTCETSWVVREYLKHRPPSQVARLVQRAKEGRIEVTGMLLNWSELADEALLAASLQPIRACREAGLPVVSAMQNDVNGAAWCLTDYFADIGIKYLSMGINHDHAALQFPRPTPFWWESPSGKRVLAFRADHYMTANAFVNTQGNLDLTRQTVATYLDQLEAKQYPFDRIAVQFSGYDTDNSPPAVKGCDLIRKWNEAYAWPKLRLATVQEYLRYIEEQHGPELPVYRVGWPDWWTDGGASAARETGMVRSMQAGLLATQGVLAMAKCFGAVVNPAIQSELTDLQDGLLYYDEHTFGAAESITDPDADNSMVQWEQKAAYAWHAVKEAGILREQALGHFQEYLPKSQTPTLAVINTLNWSRSGLVQVFIDKEIIATDQSVVFMDAWGSVAPAQITGSRIEGSYWQIWAQDVPAMGYKIYRIEKTKGQPVATSGPPVLENEYYKIVLDAETGAVKSLYDKNLEQEWVDAKAAWQLGQLVYEKVADRSKFSQDAFVRTSLRNIRIEPGSSSPIWQSVKIMADADGCASSFPGGQIQGVTIEVRLYQAEKRIEFHYSVRKLPIVTPEAMYVTFPFKLPNAEIVYEAQGGLVSPGKNQIPGSAADYQTMQNFLLVRNQERQMILGSDQAPLVMFDDFNYGKFQDRVQITRPHVYSYVMSNYWHTNFPSRQEGEIKWSYSLTSTKDTSFGAATRFGWGSRVPLLARVLLPGEKAPQNLSQSILHLAPENILLVQARPATYDQAVVLHLREVEGKETTMQILSLLPGRNISDLAEINLLEETLSSPGKAVKFSPYESKFIKFHLQ